VERIPTAIFTGIVAIPQFDRMTQSGWNRIAEIYLRVVGDEKRKMVTEAWEG